MRPGMPAAADPVAIGSLFSGVGGLDLGVTAAIGGRTAWHAEQDPHAAQVLARHWPSVPNLGDITAIHWSDIEPVCVLTAGFPCQDLSIAGPRTGLTSSTRSGLWRHVVTAIDTLRPCLVVIENVRGLLSTRAGAHALRHVEPCPRCMGNPPTPPDLRALGVVLADLADLGYDTRWTCLRASDIGAPHARARVFLVAWPRTPSHAPAPEDPDREPGPQRRLPTPHQTQTRRPRAHPGRRGRTPSPHTTSPRRHQGLPEPTLPQRFSHPCIHRRGPHLSGRGTRLHSYGTAADTDCLRRNGRAGHRAQRSPRHEPPHCRHSPPGWWADYHPAIHRWEHLTGRPAPRPTTPGTSRLAPDFVEWMMGLPTGWVTATEDLTRPTQLRLLGNSVVPQQAVHALQFRLSASEPHDNCRNW
ncbi:DNA cytosine methyltransferase [Streptomyces triticagri]|uniref:DNA (cytosine-5-)-methyltransferase n=1 Tax=Streptomyces triticagri TaxID=2293568 RepID=A0A372MBK3_9ACTN|nr:DNA (cytosine-5-)-methyltransferase [Streptomyces triticagri]RFU88281.1 DNA cytosine methyltransferase [Streptomyces triticagri]